MHTWLRLNDTTEDTLLAGLVSAAESLWTNDTAGHVLCSATFKLYLDHWPLQNYPYGYGHVTGFGPTTPIISIPRTPVTAISLVEYLDPTATWQILDSSTYSVDVNSTPARVMLPTSLPTLHPTEAPRVRVTFTAGYADASHVPADAVLGVKLLASHWYLNREAYLSEDLKDLPAGWLALAHKNHTGITADLNKGEHGRRHWSW
jgi:hypothetical protein